MANAEGASMQLTGDMETVVVPRLTDNEPSLDWLCHLIVRLPDMPPRVTLDFGQCTFVSQNAAVLLGGVIRLLQAQECRVFVHFAADGSGRQVHQHLSRNGFLEAFGFDALPGTGHAVPFREASEFDKDGLIDYLVHQWIGSGWLNVSDGLSHAVAGTVSEVYLNAFEHGDSKVGVLSCGQHYGKIGRLKLSIADFGIGIVDNIRRHFCNPDIGATRALKWAFTSGRSTKQGEDMVRGLGLGLLREFVQLNHGRLELHSNDGTLVVDENGSAFNNRQVPFWGTLVHIDLRCDENYYRLKRESPQ